LIIKHALVEFIFFIQHFHQVFVDILIVLELLMEDLVSQLFLNFQIANASFEGDGIDFEKGLAQAFEYCLELAVLF